MLAFPLSALYTEPYRQGINLRFQLKALKDAGYVALMLLNPVQLSCHVEGCLGHVRLKNS